MKIRQKVNTIIRDENNISVQKTQHVTLIIRTRHVGNKDTSH